MPLTEMPRGERIASILLLLIRKRGKKFSVEVIKRHLEQQEPVILRNVQRDLKTLADKHGDIIGAERREGRLYYFIQPDMRDKLSLPIERNGLLAFFLLKRLQPFFAPETQSLADMSQVASELSSQADYELFEDLDERLSESAYHFGEQSSLCLEGELFNDLLTALAKRKKLDIVYKRADGEDDAQRTICPVKLILFKGELFFFCISEKHEDRNYYIKLCRIVSAQLKDEGFEVSAKRMEKINKRLSDSFGMLDADDPEPQDVVLKFPSYFDLILSERRFHATQKLRRDKDGDMLLSLKVPVDRDLVQWVLGWADRVSVVKPAALKKELLKIGQMLVENNR